jgi:hypothetical protein
VITTFTAGNKEKNIPPTPVFMLVDSSMFETIKSWFSDSLYQEKLKRGTIGFEFVVSYLEKLSWLSKKDMKKLTGMQKLTAESLNKTAKYTGMAQGPKHITGERDVAGNIWPKFDDLISAPNQNRSTNTKTNTNSSQVQSEWIQKDKKEKKTTGLKPGGIQ